MTSIVTADGAVSFLLNKVDHFINQEWSRLSGIKTSVDEMNAELETIKAVLVQADKAGETHEEARQWIKQVRDLAYDIEDVLDIFIFDTAQQSSSRPALLQIKRRRTAKFIEEIKEKSSSLRTTKDKYRIGMSGSMFPSHDTYTHLYPRVDALYGTDVLGIEKPRNELIAWVKDAEPKRKVMFVVGMGGLGKTLVSRRAYEETNQAFDCSVWLSVSRSDKKQHLLRVMWMHLSNSVDNPIPGQDGNLSYLIDRLRSCLEHKSYLVVFNDFWSEEVWESVKCALPDQTYGRVIVTTRRGDIAHLCSHDQSVSIYNLQPLPSPEAEMLFHRKAFPSTGKCPEGLSELSKKFLEQCEGLPLGIISIGKLLSTKEKTTDEWMQLHDSLAAELENSGRLSSITRVLSASYIDLPYRLKYCLLYFGIFPEDHPIRRRKLIQLWISEGLVEEKPGKTLEQVGEDYLKELVQRNLVLVNDVDFSGRAKTCRLHHLLHKIILSTAQEENFCRVVKESRAILDRKVRRLSMHNGCTGMMSTKMEFPCARSFFVFGSEQEIYSSTSQKFFSRFRILKVLDMESARLKKFPNAIVNLVLLRYLSLRGTEIKKVPKSIGNLHNLETLDLKRTLVTKLPVQIFNLTKLCYLLVSEYNKQDDDTTNIHLQGFKASEKIGKLVALQKLYFVMANGDARMIKALQNLTKLRKLGMVGLREIDGCHLSSSVEKMKYLQSLDVAACSKEEIIDLNTISDDNHPKHLQRLFLKGRLQKLPAWVSSFKLHDLIRLRLKWSNLSSSPLDALKDLPNLADLQLVDAFAGEHLIFAAGKFQKLKMLVLENLPALKCVIMRNGTLANLQTLTIRRCEKMMPVLRGIDKLPLKKINLYDMPEEFVSLLQKNEGRFHFLVQHIPFIWSYTNETHKDGQMARELSRPRYSSNILFLQDSDSAST